MVLSVYKSCHFLLGIPTNPVISFFSPFQSLLELHKRRKAVTEPEARYYMMQLLKGIDYLHKNRVIHRDLKLGNIFLNDDMDVKIGNLCYQIVNDDIGSLRK